MSSVAVLVLYLVTGFIVDRVALRTKAAKAMQREVDDMVVWLTPRMGEYAVRVLLSFTSGFALVFWPVGLVMLLVTVYEERRSDS